MIRLSFSTSRTALALAAIVLVPSASAFGDIIADWNFGTTTVVAAPDNSPAPTAGTGTLSTLGMTNNYTYTQKAPNVGSTASDDVLVTASAADTSFSESTWRIRGASPGNGWNLAAPQYTQGIEADVSTIGYTGILLSFDWYATNQGVRDLQVQYNTDITNPNGWTNEGSVLAAVPNDYYGATSSGVTSPSIDLSGIPGANNDPHFGIRLVSAYDPTYTGAGSPTYTSATLTAGNPVVYNNNSGNWRFDNIAISGTAVPEPASLGLLAIGTLALIGRRRAKR